MAAPVDHTVRRLAMVPVAATVPVDLMGRTAAPAARMVQRLVMAPVAATTPAEAVVQVGLTAHGERVVRRPRLPGLMDLKDRPTIRAADHLAVLQVAAFHVAKHEQRVQQVNLRALPALMAHTHPVDHLVDLTVGNLNDGLGNDAVE